MPAPVLTVLGRVRPGVVGRWRPRVPASRSLALRGTVWTGTGAEPIPDGVVVVRGGVVTTIGRADQVPLPAGTQVVGSRSSWVGPGVFDAYAGAAVAGAVVGGRELGIPLVAGAPGYALSSPVDAANAVRGVVAAGASFVAVAIDPAEAAHRVPLAALRAAVAAARAEGLGVTAVARTVAGVERAVDGGVDELARMPIEPLGVELVGRIAASGIAVVSALQTACASGQLRAVLGNASALVAAGVPLIYGTGPDDGHALGGVDPRELDRLAEAGLGREGALRAAIDGARTAVGSRHLGLPGPITPGLPAALVVLPGDALVEPAVWRTPTAVVAPGRPLP